MNHNSSEYTLRLVTFQDLAMETANQNAAHYVLAQDPDSDRFSAAERRYLFISSGTFRWLFTFIRRQDGTWVNFTGDQLGVLFASAVLDGYKASGKPLGA